MSVSAATSSLVRAPPVTSLLRKMDSQYDSPQGQGLDLDLEEFTGKLDPYQWRLLRDILNARSFDYDIIGNLPLELVIQVFRHLDPVTPFLHQRVSMDDYGIYKY